MDPSLRPQHTDEMALIEEPPTHLTHIDPGQNMARFYEMSIQLTLFGEATVFRNWGRIGTRGQSMMVTYPQVTEASAAVTKLERQKQRRGYR